MKTYNRIVLNVPHASKEVIRDNNWFNWSKGIEEKIDKLTDWHTDILFKPLSVKLGDKVKEVVFPYNRFFCDAERLINDDMEAKGQGIYYTAFEGCRRTFNEEEKNFAYREREKHISNLQKEITDSNTLVIDCHSFPNEIAPDISICIGFNNDWSYPGDEVIEKVKDFFKGGKVGINYPFSNSITPEKDFPYHSLMIEVNKRLYLREDNSLKPDTYKMTYRINQLYEMLLGIA